MNTTRIGVDLAKTVFEIAVADTPGHVKERRRLTRARLRSFFEERGKAHVFLEACGSAHFWGRELGALGHRVSLLHPADVARYRDGNKTDRADAKALLEAARNQAIDPVPVQTEDQQAMAALHRIPVRIPAHALSRDQRSARSPAGVRGVDPPRGPPCHSPSGGCPEDDVVPSYLRKVLQELLQEVDTLTTKTQSLASELGRLARQIPAAQRLATVPGIGVLTATALVAFVGDIRRFRSGRDFAAYLGPSPRSVSCAPNRRSPDTLVR